MGCKTNMDKIQEKNRQGCQNLVKHVCPQEHNRPVPTKKDLERKFVMRVDRKGKPVIREVD